ncbi:MAG: class II aldolase/adducin family protein [Alphaproteobacteria bacterium]
MTDWHRIRKDLAAAHRLAVRDGLNEGTWNHFSYVSPDEPDKMLITPDRTHWRMVTAGNLALLGKDGELLEGIRKARLAGWIIHAPVHRSRSDANCVMHVHSPYIVAMSIRTDIAFDTQLSQQAAQFHDDVAYYDTYDGLLEAEEEGYRMAEALGDKRILLLRNHGAMVVGPSVGRAYLDLYQLERACMYQLLSGSANDNRVQRIPEDVAAAMSAAVRAAPEDEDFDAMVEVLDALEPDYAL